MDGGQLNRLRKKLGLKCTYQNLANAMKVISRSKPATVQQVRSKLKGMICAKSLLKNSNDLLLCYSETFEVCFEPRISFRAHAKLMASTYRKSKKELFKDLIHDLPDYVKEKLNLKKVTHVERQWRADPELLATQLG